MNAKTQWAISTMVYLQPYYWYSRVRVRTNPAATSSEVDMITTIANGSPPIIFIGSYFRWRVTKYTCTFSPHITRLDTINLANNDNKDNHDWCHTLMTYKHLHHLDIQHVNYIDLFDTTRADDAM